MADVLSPVHTDETLTRGQMRRRIATEVGCRTNPETPLDKSTLNSVYAYQKGEFVYIPYVENRPEHPEFVTRQEVLLKVVGAYRLTEPGDEWSTGDCPPPEELRHDELEALATYIDTHSDERPWTND